MHVTINDALEFVTAAAGNDDGVSVLSNAEYVRIQDISLGEAVALGSDTHPAHNFVDEYSLSLEAQAFVSSNHIDVIEAKAVESSVTPISFMVRMPQRNHRCLTGAH